VPTRISPKLRVLTLTDVKLKLSSDRFVRVCSNERHSFEFIVVRNSDDGLQPKVCIREEHTLGDEGLRRHTSFRITPLPPIDVINLTILEGLQQHSITISHPSRRMLIVTSPDATRRDRGHCPQSFWRDASTEDVFAELAGPLRKDKALIGGRPVEKITDVHKVMNTDEHLIMASIFVVVLPRSSESHENSPLEHLEQPGPSQALQRIIF